MTAAPVARDRPELLIVGAGPAGVSAALWAHTLGLATRVVEGDVAAGGQLQHIHFHPAEFPGVAAGDGPAIAKVMAEQLAESGVDVRYECVSVALDPMGAADGCPAVKLASGERWAADAVLIASGVRRRRLDVPGERELEGRGVSYSATRDRLRFAGLPIAVVGGGDAAYENALKLADVGCAVTLFSRGLPRARAEFRARVAAEPRIVVREQTRVTRILGETEVRGIRAEGPFGVLDQPVAGVVIKIGAVPNTEWCRGAVETDDEGYVLADAQGQTSAPRVWAAGDVTHPLLPALGVALGQAAVAVAAIRRVLRGG